MFQLHQKMVISILIKINITSERKIDSELKGKPSFRVHAQSLGVGQVDAAADAGLLLLGDRAQVSAQGVAQLAELGLASVLQAELERHLGDVVIQTLQSRVDAQQLQALAIRFPQETNPRSQDRSVSSILHVFSAHSTAIKRK